MPLRLFSRGSPKVPAGTSGTNHATELAGKESARPPLCPLQDASWNSSSGDVRNDFLTTPQSVVKWMSSSPLPDPFPESQENIASTSPEKPPSSFYSNFRLKQWTKEKSSTTSGSSVDTVSKVPNSEQKSISATTHDSNSEIDNGTVTDVPVARALKYGHSNGTTAMPASNTCGQPHFEIEEDPNFWKEHNVQVVIRLRPLSSTEISNQGQSRCVRQDSAHAITWTGHPESRFAFDTVACETITQEKIFKVAGKPMVDNCLLGYNSCMFAYGQTGSGKTFTMLGDLDGADHQPSDKRGMTPRVFEYLFARITEEEEARKTERIRFTCKCSFLEIYNEQILDLLDPAAANLQLREDARKGVYVENLSEVEVKNVHDVIRLLSQGAANRKVAATNMNRESSRSHSVFTCTIESKWTSQSITSSRYGRLNLVDLAGSERQKSSGAEGERLKEAANINKSLSTLGLVIMSLVDIANGKQRHVPYRDSKLTFLLHDSLGGNSKTTIIANISPSNCCALETLSTLKFAQRAKFIRNNAIVNENASGDIMALRMQIHQLKQEINQLRLLNAGGGGLGQLPEGIMISDGEHFSTPHSAYSLEAWDSFRAFTSPTFSNKNKSGLEIALIGSLRREQVGEARIRQLQNEIEHFKRLVKQREEDSQCGKMMLRFREDKIKRLESALARSITSDTYLLEERNSLLEEVQILRARLERNPEVTRFAMENIRLLEDLRRFQDFYEGSERDVMYEEISVLRDQLYDALDWKLMHEQDLANKAQDILPKEENTDEVDNSTLEKQIETVGAVASMQAELIAMREAVVAATNREMEAREQVSLLSEKNEGLLRGLNDLQEKNAMYEHALADKAFAFGESTKIGNGLAESGCTAEVKDDRPSRLREEIEDLQRKIATLEEQNATLHAMHRDAHATIEELKKDLEIDPRTNSEDTTLKESQICSLSQEIGDLQRRLEELQKENAALSIMLENAVSEKNAITEGSRRNKDARGEVGDKVVAEIKDHEQEDVWILKQEIEGLNKELYVLKDRNDNLHSLQLSNLATIEELKKSADVEKEEDAEKILELQCKLQVLQSVLEDVKNASQINAEFSASETIGLQNRVKSLEQDNSRLVSSYEASKEESETRISELKISLEVMQSTLESTAAHQAEICRSQDAVSSLLNGWIKNVETKFGGLKRKVDKVDAAMGYLLQDADELMSLVEKLSTELLTAFEGSVLENEVLAKELESIKSKLIDAEQARGDMCVLSSIEKVSSNDERKILQEKLKNTNLRHPREKTWRDSIREFQSKLDLVVTIVENRVDVRCGTLAEKKSEIARLHAEEENSRNSLDQRFQEEQIMLLETETLKEELKTTEQWKKDGGNSKTVQNAFSMLQLLREEEEKAKLLSAIAEKQEKIKIIKKEVKRLVALVEQTETDRLHVEDEWEKVASGLQEAQSDLEETKKLREHLRVKDLAMRKEYEELLSACLKAETEVRGFEEEYERATQFLQERFPQEAGINDLQREEFGLAEMLSDHQRCLRDIKSLVEDLSSQTRT